MRMLDEMKKGTCSVQDKKTARKNTWYQEEDDETSQESE